MKKYLSAALVLIILGSSITAFAGATPSGSAGAAISLNGLTLNFSPGVWGKYITEADASNEQWWAGGTYHGGGEKVYATSAQQTVIWKQDRATSDTFADVTIPTTKANSESEAQWTGADWSK